MLLVHGELISYGSYSILQSHTLLQSIMDFEVVITVLLQTSLILYKHLTVEYLRNF